MSVREWIPLVVSTIVMTTALPGIASSQCPPMLPITGLEAGDWFGRDVAGAGDVNNDGYPDVIIGATSAGDGGRAYVVSGRDGSYIYAFSSPVPRDRFGWSVEAAGDVNNDGFDDVIVGTLKIDGYTTNPGHAYVYSGATGGLLMALTGEAEDGWFGLGVAGVGDVNGDGYDDVLVGAPYDRTGGEINGQPAGRAFIFSGKSDSILHTFVGSPGEFLGGFVANAGDVNGDGSDDIMISSHLSDRAGPDYGAVYVYSGADLSELYVFTGDSEWGFFGFAVSGAGDLNADGFDDMLIGSIFDANVGDSIGRAYAFSGATGDLLYTLDGESPHDWFGYSVGGVGDVDHDGFDDIIVGGYQNDHAGYNAGRAYVYSGKEGTLLWVLTGESAFDNFGRRVAGCGDLNDDGYPDLIVGAHGYDEVGNTRGRAYIYYTCPAEVDLMPEVCPNTFTDRPPMRGRNLVPLRTAADPGGMPVAIVGSNDLPMADVMTSTLMVHGLPPDHAVSRDVSTAFVGWDSPCVCAPSGGDGEADLVLSVDRAAVLTTLAPWSNWEQKSLIVSGQTRDGGLFSGRDCLQYRRSAESQDDVGAEFSSVPVSSARPNPFNASTVISYRVTASGPVTLDVFDILGRRVARLVNRDMPEGDHTVSWDATNDDGRPLASGMYLYRLTTRSAQITKKLIVLK